MNKENIRYSFDGYSNPFYSTYIYLPKNCLEQYTKQHLKAHLDQNNIIHNNHHGSKKNIVPVLLLVKLHMS